MHKHELKLLSYMQKVAKQPVFLEDAFFKPVLKDIKYYYHKMHEDDPKRGFTIRMSSVGRPLCQLQMEKSLAKPVDDEANHPLRMFFGGVVEATTVAMLRQSGINIEKEQEQVYLRIKTTEGGQVVVSGTLDLVIDGEVWDIKSASPHAYITKFASYEELKKNDPFGYVCQLYGYAVAGGYRPGGWFVVDKSSGMIKVISVPDDYQKDMDEAMTTINMNVWSLVNNQPFERKFEDVPETFKRKPTGNRMLGTVCSYCKYRYSCWSNLKYLPVMGSKAFNPPHRYYTETVEEHLV